jgi:uncharacterized membrane protein
LSAAELLVNRRLRLTGSARKAVLTTHIASAVALLGTAAGLSIMGLRTAGSGDPHAAHAVYDAMSLLTLSLGIPLSFIALASGVLLAATSKWGLFGYWWVTAKLALLVGVIVIGATVTGAGIDTMLAVTEHEAPAASGARWTVVAAAGTQAAMVLTAGALSVFRPGGPIRTRAETA